MAIITPDLIKGGILRNGSLFIPESITQSIGKCVSSSAAQIDEAWGILKKYYKDGRNSPDPVSMNYSGGPMIDAYTLYYMPRNVLVPKLALLCCSFDAHFQNLPPVLHVLDLGSGTGSVVLGLLDLFSQRPFANTTLDIRSLDSSPEALVRQIEILGIFGYHGSSVTPLMVDFSDSKSYIQAIRENGPYEMVFAANLFSELTQNSIDEILQHISQSLTANGIFVNVEPSNHYARQQHCRIAKTIQQFGLNIFYPCPPAIPCSRGSCWKWRDDEFECSDITLSDCTIEPTGIQKANWMVFAKQARTIYDTLHSVRSDLVWGIAAPGKISSKDGKRVYDYEICTEQKWLRGTITQEERILLFQEEPYKRGTFVGLSQDLTKIEVGWDIIKGLQ